MGLAQSLLSKTLPRYAPAVPVKVEPLEPASPAREDPKRSGPASIKDVASAAHVSIATVSRVMNNPALVSEKTAARVQAAIKTLGYVPNPFAQGLITRNSRVLGIALPDIHGEFYSELLRGADAEARKLGYHLLVSSEHGEGERPSVAFGLIDGLAVMITDANSSLSRQASESSLPTVVLDTDLHKGGVDSILIDNAMGTREAVAHLLESVGPGRCFFVGGPSDNFDTQQRAKAFKDTLAETGTPPKLDQVAYGRYTLEWGREWAEVMLKRKGLQGAGVLAGNDEIACGVMQAAEDAGVRIPEQLRVVGFDDTRLAQIVRPRLSTVRVPMAEAGAAAVRTLVARLEDRDTPTACIRLPTTLVVRESSAGR